jgi:hypothetical protein
VSADAGWYFEHCLTFIFSKNIFHARTTVSEPNANYCGKVMVILPGIIILAGHVQRIPVSICILTQRSVYKMSRLIVVRYRPKVFAIFYTHHKVLRHSNICYILFLRLI